MLSKPEPADTQSLTQKHSSLHRLGRRKLGQETEQWRYLPSRQATAHIHAPWQVKEHDFWIAVIQIKNGSTLLKDSQTARNSPGDAVLYHRRKWLPGVAPWCSLPKNTGLCWANVSVCVCIIPFLLCPTGWIAAQAEGNTQEGTVRQAWW